MFCSDEDKLSFKHDKTLYLIGSEGMQLLVTLALSKGSVLLFETKTFHFKLCTLIQQNNTSFRRNASL